MFVLSSEECCEVVSEEGDNTVLCRVFDHLKPFLMTPWDSRVYGTYTANIRHSQMQHLDRKALERRAVTSGAGRGREPWERSEAGGVIGNERHLHHSPVSSPTEELRKG